MLNGSWRFEFEWVIRFKVVQLVLWVWEAAGGVEVAHVPALSLSSSWMNDFPGLPTAAGTY